MAGDSGAGTIPPTTPATKPHIVSGAGERHREQVGGQRDQRHRAEHREQDRGDTDLRGER